MTDSSSSAYTAYHKEVELPSRGLLYGGRVPDGIVHVEPMGTAQEKLFASNRDGAAVLNKVFDDCLISPIPHQELILGDRIWALLNIRAVSRGESYNVRFTCEACGSKGTHAINILNFEMNGLPSDFNPEADYPFKVELPIRKSVVELRVLTGHDMDAVRRYSNQVGKHTPAAAKSAAYVYKNARRIVSINDEKCGISEAMKFFESLKGLDSDAFYQAWVNYEIGPILEFEPKCSACGVINDVEEMPVNTEFFRSVKRRRSSHEDYIRTAVVLDEQS